MPSPYYYNNKAQEIVNEFAIEYFLLSVNRVLEETHDYEGESHDFWEMVYIDDGEVEVIEDGNVYLLGEGDELFDTGIFFYLFQKTCRSDPERV